MLATLQDAPQKFAHWPESSGEAGLVLLLVVLAVALAAVGAFIASRIVTLARRPRADAALFGELSDAHGLDADERRTLLKLAQREGIDHSARLFIDRAAMEALAKSSGDASLAAIVERIFGG